MKKLKFLGTAVLAASLLFAGCAQPEELDEPTPNPTPDSGYSTLTVYGAEENDVNLGVTQDWWHGP